jgi:hypothetical protein
MGYPFCRFRCGIPGNALGVEDLYDGEWFWPEGLTHYVECHSVRLPDEFIQTMRTHSWQVPAGLEFSPVAKPVVLKMIGYWWDPDNPDLALPHPEALVQPGCYGEELPRILAYLRAGRNYVKYISEIWEYLQEHSPSYSDAKEEEFLQEDKSFWLTWAARHGSK